MRTGTPPAAFLLGLAVFLGTAKPALAADAISSGLRLQVEADRAAAASQERIDQLSDETRTLLQRYRGASRELKALRAYDEHLTRMVEAQEQQIASLEEQLGQVHLTERELLPLLAQMVDSLEQFHELVRQMVDETKSMLETNRRFQDQLAGTSSDIEMLRQELAEIRQQVSQDPLTGVANRGYFEERLDRQRRRAVAPWILRAAARSPERQLSP